MAKRGRGQDKTGRSRGEKPPARLFLRTMQTPAWRALTPYAQRLYPWLQLEWSGPKENNNGSIRFSVRQAAEALDCNTETARKALHDLQAKGFIVVARCATLGGDGEARGHEYELTELGRPGDWKDREFTAPRRLFDQWRPGKDFPVVKATANNPTGKGGLDDAEALAAAEVWLQAGIAPNVTAACRRAAQYYAPGQVDSATARLRKKLLAKLIK